MKVYVLWSGYEDVEGVFSTRQKAEAHLEAHMKANSSPFRVRESYSVIEMTLDEPDPL